MPKRKMYAISGRRTALAAVHGEIWTFVRDHIKPAAAVDVRSLNIRGVPNTRLERAAEIRGRSTTVR
jgi:hypothetical protein